MHKQFDIGCPEEWQRTLPGDVVHIVGSVSRRARLLVNSTGLVSVSVSSTPDMADPVLVACSDGAFECVFNCKGDSYVQFDTDEGVGMFVKTFARAQRVGQTEGAECFTTFAPTRAPAGEYEYMLAMMRQNEKRREAHFQSRMRALEAARSVQPPQGTTGAQVNDEDQTPEGEQDATE